MSRPGAVALSPPRPARPKQQQLFGILKRTSKPKRRQQNNFILFSSGCSRGRCQDDDAINVPTVRGQSRNCSWDWGHSSNNTQCSIFKACKQKLKSAVRNAEKLQLEPFVYGFDNLHLKEAKFSFFHALHFLISQTLLSLRKMYSSEAISQQPVRLKLFISFVYRR